MMTSTTSASTKTDRLTNIAVHQRSMGLRDFVFVAFVALATVIGISSVGTSVVAAATHVVQK